MRFVATASRRGKFSAASGATRINQALQAARLVDTSRRPEKNSLETPPSLFDSVISLVLARCLAVGVAAKYVILIFLLTRNTEQLLNKLRCTGHRKRTAVMRLLLLIVQSLALAGRLAVSAAAT